MRIQSYSCFLRQKEILLLPFELNINETICHDCSNLYRNSIRHLLQEETVNLASLTADNGKLQQQLLEANRVLRNRRQNDVKTANMSLSAFGQSEERLGRTCTFGNLKTVKARKEMDAIFKCLERILTVKNKRRLDDPFVIESLVWVQNIIASIGWTNKQGNKRGKIKL